MTFESNSERQNGVPASCDAKVGFEPWTSGLRVRTSMFTNTRSRCWPNSVFNLFAKKYVPFMSFVLRISSSFLDTIKPGLVSYGICKSTLKKLNCRSSYHVFFHNVANGLETHGEVKLHRFHSIHWPEPFVIIHKHLVKYSCRVRWFVHRRQCAIRNVYFTSAVNRDKRLVVSRIVVTLNLKY